MSPEVLRFRQSEKTYTYEDSFQVGDLVDRRLLRTDEVYAGGLNDHWVYLHEEAGERNRYLLRIPKPENERETTLVSLQQEYAAIDRSGEVQIHLRTIEEQAQFIDRLHQYGVKTIDYLAIDPEAMLLPFVDGVPLHRFLSDPLRDDFGVVADVLDNMVLAHANGIVFGDRWGPNTMVTNNSSFVELDYDLALEGDHQTLASFELAQVLFHMVHFASAQRDRLLEQLETYFTSRPGVLDNYDLARVQRFLSGHVAYFSGQWHELGTLYEGIQPPEEEIALLIGLLSEQQNGNDQIVL